MMRIGATIGLLLALAAPAWALDFASTQRAAILYDAPSSSAAKVAVISAGYPLEKLVTAAGWTKVRDEAGKLAWIEASALTDKRTLLVIVPAAKVMETPTENAAVSFRAAQGVVLDLLPGQENGWAKVRHASGQQGYVRIRDTWGL
jgi:SH3-like domain-containing protein